MQSVRRAVIDVGTNSVKILVAEVRNRDVQPILEKSEQTRLGSGFYETRVLQSEAVRQTAEAIRNFATDARAAGASQIRVVATSAARDAVNRDHLISEVRRVSGMELEIISGEQEAEWVFRGVTTDPQLLGHKLLILDVGGGSTEFIIGQGEHHVFRQSFDVGSVRLFEKLKPVDPPSPADLEKCRSSLNAFFIDQIAPTLEKLLEHSARDKVRLIATGGAATILARIQFQLLDYDRAQIEGRCISRERVNAWMQRLWNEPLASRKIIAGMPSKRADIIPMGVAIYEAVMEHFKFSEMHITTRGLRFGALLEPL
jgi:exopolyphosphatase/guanosine-5'-triphosphate,3'-diphosphate pyrophosphatase